MDVDEDTYAQGMDVHRGRWFERSIDPKLSDVQRTYASKRLATMARPFHRKVDACRTRTMDVECGCDEKRTQAFGCRQHLVCPYCRLQRSLSLTTRIREALAVQWEHAPRNALLVMATISLRHTGDIHADRKELAQAWKRFRKRCQRRWGSFVFVGTFEVTPGEDRLGHVHAHMVCIWPRGKPGDATQGDWQTLRELWIDAAGTGPDGIARSTRVDFRASKRTRDAAGYIAKYVAKGVTSGGFDPVLAAKVASGTYNTRWLVTSRGFWLPWPPVCKHCGLHVTRAHQRFDFTRDIGPPPPQHHDPPEWKQTRFILTDQTWDGGHR